MKSFFASKWILALLSAFLLCVSWWQWGHPVFIFIAFVPLMQIIQRYEQESAKRTSFVFMSYAFISLLLWNIGVTWWIWNSTAMGAIMAFCINTILMVLVLGLTVFVGKSLHMRSSWQWLFPVFWIAFEYFHQNWALSWPWLQLGNVFAIAPQWVQWYEYSGTLGGSLWVWVVNLLIFFLWQNIQRKRSYRPYLISIIIVLMVPMGLSYYRYACYQSTGSKIEVVVAQPNMDPWNEQFDSDEQEVVKRIAQCAYPLVTDRTCLLVGPESALPHTFKMPVMQPSYNYKPQSSTFVALRHSLDSLPRLKVLLGASTFSQLSVPTATSHSISEGIHFDQYNSALLIDNEGVHQFYHKAKLVPGTEFIPFAKLMKPLQEWFFDLGGTTVNLGHSPEPVIFHVNDSVRVAPLICYESIYGDYASKFVRKGANLLTMITNDGWWGNTPGHRQHFNLGRLRCIELRRDMARAANTGISAFVNQRGDVISQTPYWQRTAIKAELTLNDTITFYAKFGDFIGRIAAFVTVLLCLLAFGQAWLVNKKI